MNTESTYRVAVRTLCEFTAKRGDLDLRFTPTSTALEGIAGHATVAARRDASYRSEIALSGTFEGLTVHGRADGYDPDRGVLEEVKTYRGDLDAIPANRRELHRAQARVYGALLCRRSQLTTLGVAVVYFEVATRLETPFVEQCSAAELDAFFEDQCRRFIAWSMQERAHRAERDAALTRLPFPFPAFRQGQRALSQAVYRAASAGRCLMVQAPTGIGKTIATLYPLLKAIPAQRLDKIFYLTAKTSGRRLAMQALCELRAGAADVPLRVLEFVAKDTACEHPDKTCNGASCPLARGFYDRLPQARSEAVAQRLLDKEALRAIGLRHQVCPYHLSRELAKWADVVVGDYHYYFDRHAALHGLTVAQQLRVGVLVDEAHNLVERARQMYSAALRRADLAGVRQIAPRILSAALARLASCWTEIESEPRTPDTARVEVPTELLSALQAFNAAMSEHLCEVPEGTDPRLLRFYFDALHFTRLCESFGNHSVFDLDPPATTGQGVSAGGALHIRNLVPAPFLKPRFETAHSATLFSATLSPAQFYADLLGLPSDVAWIDVESPFEASQLAVHIVTDISTRFRHREQSLLPIASLMARQYQRAPGNYLAFFSSFEYLQKVMAIFTGLHPHVPVWQQVPRMSEPEREQFLARFTRNGQGVGFAVLGGAFAEGIDLPGRLLIGAFVATLGLPRIDASNQRMMLRMDQMFGAGYDYTYLFPGVRRVVQAAGRVIRTTSDQGTVYLIDDRYASTKVRQLLPTWWQFPPPSKATAS